VLAFSQLNRSAAQNASRLSPLLSQKTTFGYTIYKQEAHSHALNNSILKNKTLKITANILNNLYALNAFTAERWYGAVFTLKNQIEARN
jgi:hypothetical protein